MYEGEINTYTLNLIKPKIYVSSIIVTKHHYKINICYSDNIYIKRYDNNDNA